MFAVSRRTGFKGEDRYVVHCERNTMLIQITSRYNSEDHNNVLQFTKQRSLLRVGLRSYCPSQVPRTRLAIASLKKCSRCAKEYAYVLQTANINNLLQFRKDSLPSVWNRWQQKILGTPPMSGSTRFPLWLSYFSFAPIINKF